MHLGHDVLAVDREGCTSRGPQRDVEHGPPLRHIDLLAPEHGIDSVAKPHSVREFEQELEGLSSDSVLRVIEIDPAGLGGHVLATLRIICEERSEMHIPDRTMMRFKRSPSRAFGKYRHGWTLRYAISGQQAACR